MAGKMQKAYQSLNDRLWRKAVVRRIFGYPEHRVET